MKFSLPALSLLACILVAPASAEAAPVPFTATYELSRNDKPAGELVLHMRSGIAGWQLDSEMRARGGMAGAVGLTTSETSRFRIHDGLPEVVQYRYRLDGGITRRARDLDVDWERLATTVVHRGKREDYSAEPGMIDRNLLAWALGERLTAGATEMTVRVAGRTGVDQQHFKVLPAEHLLTPHGPMDATRVVRTDPGKRFVAWYAAGYPVPVQLEHDEYAMRLTSFEAR